MTSKINLPKWTQNIALTGIGLCGLCCLLPVIGVALGIGGLSAAAFYLEKIFLGVLLVFVAALLFRQIRKGFTKSCALDCSCKKHHKPAALSGSKA